MELQQNLDKIRGKGLGVAAISYDPVATLKNLLTGEASRIRCCRTRTRRSFALLESSTRRSLPVLHFPAFRILGPTSWIPTGRVLSKYFEDDFTQRHMTSEILVHQFGAAAGAAHSTAETKHLALSSAASADKARPGQRIALTLDIDMKANMHVYAPGVQGYIPIEWSLRANPMVTAHAVEFPKSKMLRLEAIDETVPVYDGHFRLVRDVTIGKTATGPLIIEGTLKYQACDDRLCYVPQTVPLKWTVQVEAHDRERPPAPLQRKMQ